ncbi:MAG: SDR family oxidoreductase [Campylobacteraceae bacterium]|nr:SDR family oxidoreductase [Campylobacteraceae bacterium]
MKKVAFVTASRTGIGKKIVKKLLKKNYIVYSNGLKKDENLSSMYICADMTNEKEIEKSLNKIAQKEGRLDLIVANLGSGKSISGYDVNINEYKRVFDINLFSSICLATKSIEFLKQTNGNIIFISSIAGCEYLGAPLPYTLAKTALLSFSKALSFEVAKYNIRVNCISPGNVMFKNSTWDKKIQENEKETKEYIKNNVPLNAFVKANDIAKAVMFLEKSKVITGSNIVIDGGQIQKII